MSTQNLYVDHLAWCGLVALRLAHKDEVVITPAQENLFLCRWLAIAEKNAFFGRNWHLMSSESGEEPSTNHRLLASGEPCMSDAEKQITTK